MDDRRIRQLTEEVLAQVREGRTTAGGADLETRVSALEAAVRRLQEGPPAAMPTAAQARVHFHPSLNVLSLPGGGDQCLLEPDKPCVQSHACRTFGH